MKIGLLTSSRADFGIYYPLARLLVNDSYFSLEIIAFGTHLSVNHGETVKEIENMGFSVAHRIYTIPEGDSPQDISFSIGKTISDFSAFWSKNKFDLVLALGDRFEMFAAVSAGSPFNVKFAHLHAGETTLGAIDNAYRHCISLMSEYLFVSTDEYKNRAIEISQKPSHCFNVGALSIDNMTSVEFLSKEAFLSRFSIDLDKPSILTTFHPETVSLENNRQYISELIAALKILQNRYQIIITMPNSDTMGLMIREAINEYGKNNPQVTLVESFGMIGYLTCMKYCSFMLGNTSSGFVEAAYFPKWVINLGDRQKGRILTPNIVSCPVSSKHILESVGFIENSELESNINIYGDGKTAKKIITLLKKIE